MADRGTVFTLTGPSPTTHRERYDALRDRARELTDRAYVAGAPWQLRDEAVPLVVDLCCELGAVVLELELLRAAHDLRPTSG